MGKFDKFNIAKWQKKYLLNEGKLNEVDDDTLVKYKDEDGNDHEIKYSSAIKYDDNHPAKKAALSMNDKDDSKPQEPEKSSGELSSTDFEREPSDENKPSLDDLVKDIDADSNMADMEQQLIKIAHKNGLNPSYDEIEQAVEKRANQAGGFFESKIDFTSMVERFSKKK